MEKEFLKKYEQLTLENQSKLIDYLISLLRVDPDTGRRAPPPDDELAVRLQSFMPAGSKLQDLPKRGRPKKADSQVLTTEPGIQGSEAAK